jgi:hypothetical protein
MRYKVLGKSGVRISEVALGTMTFGEDWGWGRMSCGKPPLSPGFTAPNYPTSTTPARGRAPHHHRHLVAWVLIWFNVSRPRFTL